ncbi:MAG: tRNA (adenosine(37)-N6)-threonylcarbamoyltransferase complex transferase subunit TsaD [Planctomycetes bacterium]|nr:tRNA (adenosine(37)-N6)-threonylcarbamoyltransferase complex transferase subunit TsaD [Planctomycetota bacterium]
MRILAIESSCDETAAAVVEDGCLVRSSVVASQTDLHAEYAGVVPEIASRAHVEAILPVMERALHEAGVTWREIDAVAVGHRPGLIGSLLVGVAASKAVAWALGKPLVGVDHVHAHVYSGMLHRAGEDSCHQALFPALGLVVSGGHTSMYLLRSWTQMERLGATIDDAVGEAYDKAAAILGLPFPGGPNLDQLAQSVTSDADLVDFPISRLSTTSLDFSFSGLKTALLYQVKGVPNTERAKVPHPPAAEMTDQRRAMLAASFQKAAVGAVVLKMKRAIEQCEERGIKVQSVLVGGGVSANSRLRSAMQELAKKLGVALVIPKMAYCMDNAAMIGGLGYELLSQGITSGLDLQPVPTTAC